MLTIYDPLKDVARDFGIADREYRGFLREFHRYVDRRDSDEMLHRHACDRLSRRWRDVFADLYRVILDEPHLYW